MRSRLPFAIALGFALVISCHALPANPRRRMLIQGEVEYQEDVTGISVEDAWPFTVGLAGCRDGGKVLTSVVCGASLIHPYVVMTAGTSVSR